VRIAQGIDKVMFEIFLLRVCYLNNFRWCYCKTCLFRTMQSRDNDKMLYSECNARYITMNVMHCLRCMFAMIVQHEDEGSHARLKWCIWHNAITMMQCSHHDARMMILAMYARMKCMKYDAYPHELMMHVTRTLQHLDSLISLNEDQKLGH
jgi:hypothetical protein